MIFAGILPEYEQGHPADGYTERPQSSVRTSHAERREMPGYRVDDLGWYMFEQLIQALLKHTLGLALESWGGRGDHGRDAYHPGPLHYPDTAKESPGPFVFQVKFVENANAAGANAKRALTASATAEVRLMRDRIQKDLLSPDADFTLVTNAPISADLRKAIKARFKKVVANVHILGGRDVSSLLDDSPEIRRSFPQLLGLTDLQELLRQATSHEVLERSQSAVLLARDIAEVFVPTEAYVAAWSKLLDHHFVVLEGPPETGKTAIAWMIALTLVARGWEAVICQSPDDFFDAYRSSSKQVFVADDAFGRTEYDPSRGNKWEAQLHFVLSRSNSEHLLIWTSRKHILERAINTMDLQSSVARFPSPAEVVVDATKLSEEERALILYRHAKSSQGPKMVKSLIKNYAQLVVNNPNFTPERARLLVAERLPSLVAKTGSRGPTKRAVLAEITEAIQNPTERSRRTFRALPLSHQWWLFALLESDHDVADDVSNRFEALCPPKHRQPSQQVFDELREAFVTVRDSVWVDWIHPSYRDLVIDELSADEELAQAFLSRMSREGVKLALSSTGGSDGTRALPLLRSADAWRTLDKRLLELIETMNQKQLAELLVAITIEAAHTANQSILKQNWSDLLTVVLASVLSGWDTNKVLIEPETLEAFVAATTFTVPLIAVPDLQATWAQAYDDFLKASQELDIEKIDRFVRIATVAKNNEPRFLDQQDFPSDDALNAFEKILETIESERAERQREMGERVGPDGIPYYEMPYDDPEELSGLGFEFEGYATTCWRIARLKLPLDGDPESLDSACTEIASELNDMAGALAAEGFADMYQDSYHEARLEHEHASSFSVDGLFSDL